MVPFKPKSPPKRQPHTKQTNSFGFLQFNHSTNPKDSSTIQLRFKESMLSLS